ncbi:MAG: TraR/DksA family transcriptional regulator [Chitinophagales bacterium]|nr:TraR/DksA family transcriptional regulator [Chitinophagales bacterium]
MKKEKKEELRILIEKEITKTREKIVEFKEMSKPVAPENAIGRVSRMDAINNKAVAEAALRNAENKLKQLIYMEQTVDDADFGKCAKCKADIPLKRIVLMPQSRFCVNCAR